MALAAKPLRSSRLSSVAWRAIEIILAVLALASAVGQLAEVPTIVEEFERIGLGRWLRYVTAMTLLAGGLLLLKRRTTALGAIMLCAVCIGAFVAQFAILHGDVIHTIVPALLPGAIAWVHRGQFDRRVER